MTRRMIVDDETTRPKYRFGVGAPPRGAGPDSDFCTHFAFRLSARS
jgi:hypothetical protein